MTQPQCDYFLQTVLLHLPKVEGSEGPIDIHLIQCRGYNHSSGNFDEPDQFSNLYKEQSFHNFSWQTEYLITLSGHLRDTHANDVYKQIVKYLARLAKRVPVTYVLVSIEDVYQSYLIRDKEFKFMDLYEHQEAGWWDEYAIQNNLMHAKYVKGE